MSIQIEVMDFNDKEEQMEFDKLLLNCKWSLIQQSTYWGKVVKDISPDIPYFLVAKENGKWIGGLCLYLYSHEFGNILTSNPHAGSMGSVSIQENSTKPELVYQLLLEYAVKLAEELNCITLSLSTNPFLDDHELFQKYLKPDTGIESYIQVIWLNEFFNEQGEHIFRDYIKRSNLSRNVRKSYKSGLKFIDYCDVTLLKEWYKIHSNRLTNLGATPLPFQIFENVLNLGRENENMKYIFAEYNDELVGGCLNIFNKNVFDIFMLSSDMDTAQELGTNFFLVDSILKFVNKLGIPVFNWQSSNPPTGGSFRFKKQWGSKVLIYYYYTKIIGDLKHLQNMNLNSVKNAYNWHFVAPYHSIIDVNDKRIPKKAEIYDLEKSKSNQ